MVLQTTALITSPSGHNYKAEYIVFYEKKEAEEFFLLEI
jgi:hypothetical protein